MRTHPLLIGLALPVLLLAGCAGPVPAAAVGVPVPAAAQEATVVRGVDGDTVVLRGRGSGPLPASPMRVRVLLVDTPEVRGEGECFGEQAADRTAQLLPEGASVRVLADRDRLDRFDRTLLHVWTSGGVNVGEALVREGFATVLVLPPNRAYEMEFRAAEREAQEARRGLWAACRKG